ISRKGPGIARAPNARTREVPVVKKIDYYAVQNPWRMPKWIGATLGGIFGVIAIGSMITIVQPTRSPTPVPVPVAAAPVAATPEATTAKASAPVASADDAAPVSKKHAKKHAAAHGKKAKLM